MLKHWIIQRYINLPLEFHRLIMLLLINLDHKMLPPFMILVPRTFGVFEAQCQRTCAQLEPMPLEI
jgi:hypothetical protein